MGVAFNSFASGCFFHVVDGFAISVANHLECVWQYDMPPIDIPWVCIIYRDKSSVEHVQPHPSMIPPWHSRIAYICITA